MSDRTIYIKLVNEPVDVWRPVRAREIDKNTYEILMQEYDGQIEEWQFKPGEIVICERISLESGEVFAAVRCIDDNIR